MRSSPPEDGRLFRKVGISRALGLETGQALLAGECRDDIDAPIKIPGYKLNAFAYDVTAKTTHAQRAS